MELLLNKIQELIKLDYNQMTATILQDSDFQKWMLDTIRQKQLYEQGIRGDGTEIGQYSLFSKLFKIDRNIDHITLKETGAFYNSFKIVIGYDDFFITGNGDKVDELGNKTNLFDRYDNNGTLLSFTEENEVILSGILQRKLLEEIWKVMIA